METISQIKARFEQTNLLEVDGLFSLYEQDNRAGVQKIIKTYQKKIDAYNKEQNRLENMLQFEKKYSNYKCICGIDEAGRGPFAGPVVAGAVVLPVGLKIQGLNDSKKISKAKREELFDEIKEKAISYGVGMASPQRIDEINILQATYEAMRDAISNLKVEPDILLNDAVTIPLVQTKQVAIIKGDARSLSIAAASIIAKVTRDRIMEKYALEYPQYGFENHKGYGSLEHRNALKEFGQCPIHRKTFIHNWI